MDTDVLARRFFVTQAFSNPDFQEVPKNVRESINLLRTWIIGNIKDISIDELSEEKQQEFTQAMIIAARHVRHWAETGEVPKED